jgi:hypothetical protein
VEGERDGVESGGREGGIEGERRDQVVGDQVVGG